MKILNIGSINIDKTYTVDHFVQPGETLTSDNLEVFCGGKGLNQSIALAAAGATVSHLGAVGGDGDFLIKIMNGRSVDTSTVRKTDVSSGHAIIQVNKDGQNCILLFSGSNHLLQKEWIDDALKDYNEGDWILLQNETNCLDEAMREAAKRKVNIAFNPSPMDERILSLPLELVSCFFINEIEGEALSGEKGKDKIIDKLLDKYPHAKFVLTLGKNGACYADSTSKIYQPCFPCKVLDTTGAGDTFTGFFLANYINGTPLANCMLIATMASTIQISRDGASVAIPSSDEVMTALSNL